MGTKLSKRAKTCVGLMEEGAYWRRQLESQYRGGEKFTLRLKSASGHVIHGFGFQTWNELETAGMLAFKECLSSSVWPTEWALKVETETPCNLADTHADTESMP